MVVSGATTGAGSRVVDEWAEVLESEVAQAASATAPAVSQAPWQMLDMPMNGTMAQDYPSIHFDVTV
jgi:hypothetical protein